MSTAQDVQRDRLTARVAEAAGAELHAGLVAGHLRHVASEDLAERPPEAWAAVVEHLARRAAHRDPGHTTVGLLASGDDSDTPAGRSVLEVVTDDMPFLVDSVLLELARQGSSVHLVVHPRWWVLRDADGAFLEARAVEQGPGPDGPREWVPESWIRIEVDPLDGDEAAAALVEGVRAALDDVRAAVDDWEPMRDRLLEAAAALSPEDAGRDLLEWVAADHFTFLGAADLTVDADGVARPVAGTGLGIFSEAPRADGQQRRLPEAEPVSGLAGRALVVDKAIDRSTVHRSGNLDRLTVRTFDESGRVVAERRVLGLWSSRARSESVMRIPGLQLTIAEVLARVGVDPHEHAGKAVVDALEGYPRDELFAADADELVPVAQSAASGGGARRLRAFVRRDSRGRYVSVLVHLPRESYSTAVRERFSGLLRELFAGDLVEFNVRLDDSGAARVHFLVHPPEGSRLAEPAEADVEAALARAARSWRDDLAVAAVARWGEGRGTQLVRDWARGLPEGYKESTPVEEALDDLDVLDRLPDGEVALRMVSTHQHSEHLGPERQVARFVVVSRGAPVPLSKVLPLLQSAGVEVVHEHPHEVTGPRGSSWVYAFAMSHPADLPYAQPDVFVDAVRAMWDGRCDVDGFNALVLEAGLTWRQVQVLRAYGAYLRQGRFPFTRDSTVAALRSNVEVTRLLAALFDTRFDPDLDQSPDGDRAAREAELEAQLDAALAAVEGREHDRILRTHRAVVDATLRTNRFRTDVVGDPDDPDLPSGPVGEPRAHLALKLAPRRVPGLPEPRPEFEVFVHSPRLEGVHLRFGAVARGGLRWSDRRDDFRTEVLGLVKAQMVKNTVIVPVGAKGGFVAKQLPDPKVDREAWWNEGVASYRAFISCLLDVTDNLVDGEVVPPPRVVRRDGDDHYLVVAADKGTATFSDTANALAADHGFWLGDAFASGGSVGYDHKGMGITARGAWVSVQRHFRERGVDVQNDEFTCVGIGDMSGDVFGNGLLCSPTTRLLAAFDHRDIFVDPDPDAARSYEERRRLFDTPRTSWQDYDRSLISPGGGVFSRSAKSVPVSAEMRRALGIDGDVDEMSPEELMRAVLTAPVDLLWNGGIGTYVKASTESHADVGDSANDAIRVDGRDLRVRVVGEGGNLGLTQAGRVELARTARARGGDPEGTPTRGAVNTDFIDNSAGVDTSDHEVNIKILLDAVVLQGDLDVEQRAEVLASMTDEVGRLVLADNYRQNLALADEAAGAAENLHLHEQWMRDLEERGVLDRELEALPSRTEVRRRREAGEGLTVPELSVLLSWTKIVMASELVDSSVPDDPYLRGDLIGYFPSALRQERRAQMTAHPLRREIVTTQVVNTCVDQAGVTAWSRLEAETGASADRFVLAHLVAAELFGTAGVREQVAELDHRVEAAVQTRMRAAVRDLQERATRWLLVRARGSEVDTEEIVDAFGVQVQRLLARLPELVDGAAADDLAARRAEWVGAGVPDDLASTVAALPEAAVLLDVVRTATRTGAAAEYVTAVHLALGERLGIHRLRGGVEALPRSGRWEASAATALRDDLAGTHAALTELVVSGAGGSDGSEAVDEAADRVERWGVERSADVAQVVTVLDEVLAEGQPDLARASVAVRTVRELLAEE